MKNKVAIVISIICVIAVILGCAKWYKSEMEKALENSNSGDKLIVQNSGDKSENLSGENITDEEISTEPIYTLEDYPRVDASLAIHPLVDSIASNFLGIPEDELEFEYTKTRTSDVYKNLVDGNVDVIFAAEPSQADLDYAKSKGVELEVKPVTSSAFVFIVNSENPVEELTLEEIVKIYKGEITNWKEVGGEDEEIIPYQRPNGSGSQTAMISLVMKDANLMSAPKMQIEAEMGGLIDAVAEYDNSKAAIGYSYFYYVNTMYKRDTIKMVAVDGVEPSIETIKNGEYPIYTNGYIVSKKGDEIANKWIENVTSARGSKIIEDAGYVPMY